MEFQIKKVKKNKRSALSKVKRNRSEMDRHVLQIQARQIKELKAKLTRLERESQRIAIRDIHLAKIVPPRFGKPKDEPKVVVAYSAVKGAKVGELDAHWAAVRKVMELAGYEVLVEGVEQHGSVLKAWAIKRAKKKAKLLADAAAMAIQDNYVRKPGAEATLTLAKAIREVFETAGDRECLHFLDNVVIGQRYGDDGELKQFSKELTMRERKVIAKNPAIVNEPRYFLDQLAVAVANDPDEAPARTTSPTA